MWTVMVEIRIPRMGSGGLGFFFMNVSNLSMVNDYRQTYPSGTAAQKFVKPVSRLVSTV